MKEINLPSGNYIFVEVPNDAYDFEIADNFGLIYWVKDCVESTNLRIVSLEKANYQIVSTTNDITEEQAENIVKTGSYMNTFHNYLTNDTHKSNQLETAKESLQSLIQANELDVEQNYLILKKML